MYTLPNHFRLPARPHAHPESIVQVAGARFTVLTPRLIRLEHSPTNTFEDRPSQMAWFRDVPPPAFSVEASEHALDILTEAVHLHYTPNAHGFTRDTLSITVRATNTTWHYGDRDGRNLRGTARTLDNVSGRTELEPGLLSRSGWSVVDDSATLVFTPEGWLVARPPGQCDVYFFGYGPNYQAALDDYAALAGPMPLIPRWALGNWWSRYWAYSDQELLGLMDEFAAHQVPLAVCIVDMDWHLTDNPTSSGWTGYTWNPALFPDPPGFVAALHRRGLKTALNLHPADGVHPHESAYPRVAERLSVPGGAPVPFDCVDPQFMQAYFEELHHPLETQGVDFWWMDWQQGKESAVAGLDPLWWLNHLHFLDLARDGHKRAFVFSRWGGLGNHRYPIGFSGDTLVTWESLAFQPHFTATAANVAYGWWSHDIGGHMGGVEEAELYVRWVQFGVFSPIMRLHSTKNPFHERRPWGWDAETSRLASHALRLRHALIPYLYSMAWRAHTRHTALVRPLYHTHPAEEAAYHCPHAYWFGSELLAAPFTAPRHAETGLSRTTLWLPPGEWFGLFTPESYQGGRWVTLYGTLDDIPVLARAGAVIPLSADPGHAPTTPSRLRVHLFPGSDGAFDLYEDDGESQAYLTGDYAITPIQHRWHDSAWDIDILAVRHHSELAPAQRTYELVLHHIRQPDTVELHINNQPYALMLAYDDNTGAVPTMRYDDNTCSLHLEGLTQVAGDALNIHLSAEGASLRVAVDPRQWLGTRALRTLRLDTWVKGELHARWLELMRQPDRLEAYRARLTDAQWAVLHTILQHHG